MEEIELFLEEAKDHMDKALKHVQHELGKVRAGKAVPQILDDLKVAYYGNPTPINQVASINTPDARTIVVKPWEKSLIPDLEKAIQASDLGLNPQSDGETLRIFIPPLTEERRLNLVKHARHEAELGKVSVRNVRKDINDSLKKLQKEGVSEDDVKRGEDKVQELTNDYSKKIDDILAQKEEDIMTV